MSVKSIAWNDLEKKLAFILGWPDKVEGRFYLSVPSSLRVEGLENAEETKLEITTPGLAKISTLVEDGKRIVLRFSDRESP